MTWVDVTIEDVRQETVIDRSFVLAVPAVHREAYRFTPGQYVRLRDPADPTRREWYFSLSAAPNPAGTLRVTVRGKGDLVQGIYGARTGTRWQAASPAGAFLITPRPAGQVLLAAAGSGVTPFRAFLEQTGVGSREAPVCLLQCARAADELLFLEEFRAWAEARTGFAYVPTVTGPATDWNGRSGRIDRALLAAVLAAPGSARVYACGPRAFVDELLSTAEDLGVPRALLRGEGH